MKKKIILILIQIFVVAMALALTVTTYAWFVSTTSVNVEQTTITAAAGANVFIEKEEDFEYTPYKGETGEDDENDSPYIVEKNLTVTFNPIDDDSAITARILSVKINLVDGSSVSSETDPEVLSNFTWRVKIDGNEYGPDKNGFLCLKKEPSGDEETEGGETTDEIIDGGEEGGSESGEDVAKDIYEYYEIKSGVTLDLTFRLIFLDEASYTNWLKGDYGSVEPFKYSDYKFMRSTFTCGFEIGIAPLNVTSGGEGE